MPTKAKQTQSSNGSSARRADPVTAYAQDVCDFKIAAGPHVRRACERHLRDLRDGPARGLRFDTALALKGIDFFPAVLRLAGGEFENLPFTLLRWEQFIVGSIFGWLNADGSRRFRVAYVETGKGSGKSPLAAGLGLYGLVADGEDRAEIYAAATKRDQAMILFRDAVAAAKLSPHLRRRLHLAGGVDREWNIAYHETGSFFRPLSSDEGQSGPRVHMGLIDEIHEHKSNDAVEMLQAGTKKRRNALVFMITNSGSDRETVCWAYHDYAIKVARLDIEDDSFFSYVCACDDGEDPFDDERCWLKSNPSLDEADLPGIKYLRQQVRAARNMPSKESVVRRLNFCEWTDADSPWISRAIWEKAQASFTLESLRGRRCVAGLDLGSVLDMTAFAMLFQPEQEGEKWMLVVFFWTPEETIEDREERDRVPYKVWVKQGYLTATPGKAISRLYVLRQIAVLCNHYNVEKIGFDRWRIDDFQALADDEGIELPEMIPCGMGSKDMESAISEFESRFALDTICHDGNPVLTWNAASITLEIGPSGDRRPTKRKSTGRIDGMISALMAIKVSMSERSDYGSIFEDRARAKEEAARNTPPPPA